MNSKNKIIIIGFLFILIIATLFPPFVWNAPDIKKPYANLSYSGYKTIKIDPVKSYSFLFSDNKKQLNKNTYSRSILFYELLAEYFLIIFLGAVVYLIINKNPKEDFETI